MPASPAFTSVFQTVENSSQFCWSIGLIGSRAGVKDQHVGHLLPDDLVHKGGVGCVAGNHRSAGMLGRREVRSIAANCGHVGAAGG